MQYNGGSVIAMVGKDCVAIASDLRLGVQSLTITSNFEKVHTLACSSCAAAHPSTLCADIPGYRPAIRRTSWSCNGCDNSVRIPSSHVVVQVSNRRPARRHEQFRYRVNMYTIKEEREIEPQTFAQLVSSTLYQRRFGPYFIEPVIAGMQRTPSGSYAPFIAATDLIGCLNFAKDFVVAGTASEKLFGVAEGLWEPDLEPEDLFETISQTLLNALDRDAFSGWGAVVHIM